MSRLLYSLLQWIACKFKGKQYELDTRLPLEALAGLAYRRGISLLRGIILHPSQPVFAASGVELRNRSLISFGKGVTLGRSVVIDGLSVEGVKIGNGANIGPYTIIEATGSITDLGKGIRIGSNSGIGGFSFIGGAGGVEIGKDVIMGQWVSFHPENHNYDRQDIPIRLQGVNRKGIVIGDNCWVGAKVTFLDGAHVGSGCVIAAGSVVRGKIPDNVIVAGVPARIIKSRQGLC